jgi:hypothetical protein
MVLLKNLESIFELLLNIVFLNKFDCLLKQN